MLKLKYFAHTGPKNYWEWHTKLWNFSGLKKAIKFIFFEIPHKDKLPKLDIFSHGMAKRVKDGY